MNSNLSLIKKANFNNVECDLWKDENNQIWMTREQIGTALEYGNPRESIKNIHARNKIRLDKFAIRYQFDTPLGIKDMYLYNAKGVYEICRYSKQPKANDFYDWVYELLEGLRSGDIELKYNIPQTYAEALQLSANLQLKVEEYQPKAESYDNLMNSNGLFNFREVSSTLGVCGRNTLFKILRENKILSDSNFNKNLPYAKYKDYFQVKIQVRKTSDGMKTFGTTLCKPRGIKLIENLLNEKGLLS